LDPCGESFLCRHHAAFGPARENLRASTAVNPSHLSSTCREPVQKRRCWDGRPVHSLAPVGPTSMRKPLSRPERDDRGTSQTSIRHHPRGRSAMRGYAVAPRGRPVGVSLPAAGASRVARVSRMSSCRCQYPGEIMGSDRSWDGLFHPFPCSPTTAAFPVMLAGRLPHHRFRGLLSIHSRYGLMTRCTAERYKCLEGSDGFVTSTAAPIAPGRSDRVGRAGLAHAG
jgi:hypothetical protein